MDLPVIDTPVFPRWVWMEEITYSHIPIATIITAFMVLAPVIEYIGYRKGDPRYDRLAKGFIWFAMILFSPGAALGTGIAVFIIGAYPEFWARWSDLFFWPLVLQFVLFTIEVGLLFFGYYLSWDRWINRKRLHITFGVLAALAGLSVQFVWDALAGYMMTPGGVPLPEVGSPVAFSLPAFFNPSFPYLFIHRFFGNISYVMLLVGGVYALRTISKKKDPAEIEYFRWASDKTFTLGFLCFFAMPLIGWFYAAVIQAEAPVAFRAMMGGHVAPHFIVKMSLIAVFLALGGAYLFSRYKTRAIPIAITAGLLGLLAALQIHPPLDWFGGDRAWRVAATVVPLALIVAMWALHGRANPDRTVWRWLLFVAGLCAFATFTLGGFIRERSTSPDTVYGEIVKPEVTEAEADRFLLYDKLLTDDFGPADLRRLGSTDWAEFVAARRRDGLAEMTDAEAARVVRYLQEHYP